MKPIWLLEDEPIRVCFDSHGYAFYKGASEIIGTPIEAFLRLIAIKGDERIEVQCVNDLKRLVTIRSPEEALEFVELFTSLKTHYLFPTISYLEPEVTDDVPGVGQYTKEYAKRLKIEATKSRQEGESFVIVRNLMDKSGRLFRATERVNKDGDYSLIKEEVVDEHSPIIYPLYQ